MDRSNIESKMVFAIKTILTPIPMLDAKNGENQRCEALRRKLKYRSCSNVVCYLKFLL
jgi:hypothetical protein